MSFQEKNITVSLVNFSLILLFFVVRVAQLWLGGTFTATNVFWLWGVIIVLAIFVTIAATILTHIFSAIIEAIKSGGEEPEIEDKEDERDRLIDLRGTRVSYSISSGGAFLAMLTFVLGQPPLIMFTLLIFFGVISQIAGDYTRLRLYRRGF